YGRGEKYLYILGADYMGRYLNDKWGKAEISITATDSGKTAALEQIKDKKGIVVMKGNYSHTTLWNGSKFVDVENGMARNYYLTNIGTAKLELWELK
ncbi:T6SS effector amidase Tae4 family protein, partial [Helicobacter cinaedi]